MSDLIDRQAAIDTLDKHLRTTDVPVSYPGIISALTEWLNELPSAQADSKETSSTHKALDTISRNAAIDEIARWIGYIDEDMISRIQTGLKKLPSAQPERRWIPCSERMPEERQEILATTTDNAWGDVVIIRTYYKEMHKSVIAWMPLPEPYAERKTDERPDQT